MSVKQRKFSKEFKITVINEVRSGQSQASIARKYSINAKVLNRWISELETYGDDAFAGKGNTFTDSAKMATLSWRIEQLEAENELLKKALTQLDMIRNPTQGGGEQS